MLDSTYVLFFPKSKLFYAELILENIKCICIFYNFSILRWCKFWNSSSTYVFCIVNATVADDLVTKSQGISNYGIHQSRPEYFGLSTQVNTLELEEIAR